MVSGLCCDSAYDFWESLFLNYVKLKNPTYVIIGDATVLEVGVVDYYMGSYNGQDWKKIVLKKVLHVPRMSFNLFSVIKTLDKGYTSITNSRTSKFMNANNEILVMSEQNGDVFKIKFCEIAD